MALVGQNLLWQVGWKPPPRPVGWMCPCLLPLLWLVGKQGCWELSLGPVCWLTSLLMTSLGGLKTMTCRPVMSATAWETSCCRPTGASG